MRPEANFAQAAVTRLVENPAVESIKLTLRDGVVRIDAVAGEAGTSCARTYEMIAACPDAATLGFLAAGECLARLGIQ